MWNWIKKIFGAIKSFYVRNGLDKFLGQYIQVAVEVLTQLALVNNNAAFHTWKDQAFDALKNRIGKPVADNWIALLIGFAFENLKAKQSGNKSEIK